MNITIVKDLAQTYSAHQLEECLLSEIDRGSNTCIHPDLSNTHDEAIDSLAKAQTIRESMERDRVTLTQAMRDLAHRIRNLQSLEQH